MKNIAGFDRRGWRTGFTNYRFAIPDFAGGAGRAIYNDVDQIYLADPALLFDLELGDHGYLAISPKDTSVMLIDCARMRPLWNRFEASSGGKHKLTNRPAETPNLWGRLDPQWNARDTEYREELTKCLHYTALHQQPWHPFPGDYSYHPNPLAYIWYALERDADAAGFQVFTREHPSLDFARRLGSNAVPPSAMAPPDAASMAFLQRHRAGSTLALTCGVVPADAEATDRLDLTRSANEWPDGQYALVIVSGVLDRIPPADVPWVLDEAFARSRRAVGRFASRRGPRPVWGVLHGGGCASRRPRNAFLG